MTDHNGEKITEKQYLENEEFPLYPRLSDEGKEQTQRDLNEFGELIKKSLDGVLSQWIHEFIEDYIHDTEHAAWQSLRQRFFTGLRAYNRNKKTYSRDYQVIRDHIFDHYREDLIKDIDQDNIKKIEQLESQLKRLADLNYRR